MFLMRHMGVKYITISMNEWLWKVMEYYFMSARKDVQCQRLLNKPIMYY